MSTEMLLILAVLVVGILAAIGLIVLNRSNDENELTAENEESEFIMAPYGELKKILAEATPVGMSRKELSMTPEDIVELVDVLEGEVTNGGFDQFFFNYSGDYAIESIQALKEIGANHTAELVQLACDRFPQGLPPIDISDRRTLLLESVSPDSDTFDDLDSRFYKYEDPLFDLIEKYKEKHSL